MQIGIFKKGLQQFFIHFLIIIILIVTAEREDGKQVKGPLSDLKMVKIGAAEAKIFWFLIIIMSPALKMLDPQLPIMQLDRVPLIDRLASSV